MHRFDFSHKLVDSINNKNLLCHANLLHTIQHAKHFHLILDQNLLLFLFCLSVCCFMFLSALLAKWSKSVTLYVFSIIRIFIRLMCDQIDSADFTYQLSLILHALRAGARAAEVIVTVIDQRKVKESWNKTSLYKRDMLNDCMRVFCCN